MILQQANQPKINRLYYYATPGIKLSKVPCVSAELLAEVLVRLGVARQTIHRVQDYSICFEEVYSLLQTFIATVRYTLQIVVLVP